MPTTKWNGDLIYKVDGSGSVSLPLPTGASTEATLALIKAKTDNLDVALSTRTKPADTQAVSAVSLPLPSGASTAAKQPALGTAGAASSDVISIQGISNMTPLLASSVTSNTSNGLFIYRNLDVDETGVNVSTGVTQLYGWRLYNNASSPRFVKFYDLSSDPTVGTSTPILTLSLPANSQDVFFNAVGIPFMGGIGVGATSAVADNDTTAPSANDVVMVLFYYVASPITSFTSLVAWYRSDQLTYQDSALTTVASVDGDPVGGWKDLTTNAFNALQATAANRPLLKLNIRNGLHVLRFDGTDDYLKTATFSTISQPTTVFVVGAQSSANNARTLFDGNTNTSHNLENVGNGVYRISAGTTLNTTTTANINWNIRMAQFNGVSSIHRTNGVQDASGNAGAGSLAAITIGARGSTFANSFLGDIAEVIVFNVALSTAQIKQVEKYLSQRYAIAIV